MLLSLIYFAVRRLLRLVTASGDRDDVARDVELLVLRHQLRVLSRSRRLQLKRRDRILFAAASELLPHKMWRSLPVSPQTVLRWHRELVRRKWTYCHNRHPDDSYHPARKRKPTLGLPAHSRGTSKARGLGLGNQRLCSAPPQWTPAGSTTRRPFLEGVPNPASRRHHGL
jgi:hypothetical protein